MIEYKPKALKLNETRSVDEAGRTRRIVATAEGEVGYGKTVQEAIDDLNRKLGEK